MSFAGIIKQQAWIRDRSHWN